MIDKDYEVLIEIISILHKPNMGKDTQKEEEKVKVEKCQNKQIENLLPSNSKINVTFENEDKKEPCNKGQDFSLPKINEINISSTKSENYAKKQQQNGSDLEKQASETNASDKAKNDQIENEEKKLDYKQLLLGKNKKCHCGSKKQYKKCCMLIDKFNREKEAKDQNNNQKESEKKEAKKMDKPIII